MINYGQARELAASLLGEKRLHHSECVAEAAARLAPGFGADTETARVTGMIHDIMKERPDEELIRLMGGPEAVRANGLEGLRPLWHAWAGAVYAEKVLGLDSGIADAVRYHTSGRAGMSPLEKTVFLADYISSDRTFEGSAEVRKKAEKDQDAACLMALQNMICHLVSSGRKLDLRSPEAYDWFLETISNRER